MCPLHLQITGMCKQVCLLFYNLMKAYLTALTFQEAEPALTVPAMHHSPMCCERQRLLPSCSILHTHLNVPLSNIQIRRSCAYSAAVSLTAAVWPLCLYLCVSAGNVSQ